MANFNKVILVGNLTRDPQLSYLPNQTPVVELGLAVNRKYRDKEETCFVDCNAYGKPAEIICQYMRKGNPILIEGRLQYSQWESKDGQKRSKLRVVVEQFQFLGGTSGPRGDGQQAPGGYQQQDQGGGGYSAPPQQQQAPQANNAPEPAPPAYGGNQGAGGDNIPF